MLFKYISQVQAILCQTTNGKEKESCLCIRCFNIHCLLKGINIYRTLKKLDTFAPATVYLECERNKETNPKTDDEKEISYYVFEKKKSATLRMERK